MHYRTRPRRRRARQTVDGNRHNAPSVFSEDPSLTSRRFRRYSTVCLRGSGFSALIPGGAVGLHGGKDLPMDDDEDRVGFSGPQAPSLGEVLQFSRSSEAVGDGLFGE